MRQSLSPSKELRLRIVQNPLQRDEAMSKWWAGENKSLAEESARAAWLNFSHLSTGLQYPGCEPP